LTVDREATTDAPEAFEASERTTLPELRIVQPSELRTVEAVADRLLAAASTKWRDLLEEERQTLLEHFETRLEQRQEVTLRAIRQLRDDVTSAKIERELAAVPSGQPTPVIVLIVDDDDHLRMLLRRLCESRAMKVFDAKGTTEAMNVLDLEPIDVVLTDLAMPHNGSRLHEYVKQSHEGCEVVIMSGGDEAEAAGRALDSGAFSFLTKPFRSNEQVVLTITRAAEARQRRRHGPGR